MKIEELITQHRNGLDTELPPTMIWDNIKKNNATKVFFINRSWLMIAASIVLIMSVFFIINKKSNSGTDVKSPEDIVIQNKDKNNIIDSTPKINGKDTQGLKQFAVNDTNETTKSLLLETEEINDVKNNLFFANGKTSVCTASNQLNKIRVNPYVERTVPNAYKKTTKEKLLRNRSYSTPALNDKYNLQC